MIDYLLQLTYYLFGMSNYAISLLTVNYTSSIIVNHLLITCFCEILYQNGEPFNETEGYYKTS